MLLRTARARLVHTLPPLRKKTAKEAVNNILYNTSLHAPPTRRILSCLVTNEPGVLSRISGVLAGRGFNIDSLVASETEVADLSRMTVVIRGADEVVDQVRKQLEDMVPVWAVLDYSDVSVIERELVLVRMGTDLGGDTQRHALIELTKLFEGRIVDMTLKSMTIELSAKKQRVEAFLALLRPYNVLEVVRSGVMVMPRAKVEGTDEEDSSSSDIKQAVDVTMLPPG